jgi:hypothetical protein
MTIFSKYAEPFSSNKVVSKIVFTRTVISKNAIKWGEFVSLIVDFSGDQDSLNPLYFLV